MALTAYAFTHFTTTKDFNRLEKKVDKVISFILKKEMK